jgi:hypothetical protein
MSAVIIDRKNNRVLMKERRGEFFILMWSTPADAEEEAGVLGLNPDHWVVLHGDVDPEGVFKALSTMVPASIPLAGYILDDATYYAKRQEPGASDFVI